MTITSSESGESAWLLPLAGPAVPARQLRRRLRTGVRASTHRRPRRFSDVYVWVLFIAVLGAIAAGLLRHVGRVLTGPGWAVAGAPGRLFAAAAVLLLLGGLAHLLRAAGPVTASSAFRFWLLATPASRRHLLRRRYLGLTALIAILTCVIAALVAHAASVAVLPAVAVAALASVILTAGSVWGQASETAERALHITGRTVSATSMLLFGSLATGVARGDAEAAVRASPAATVALLATLGVVALACCWRGYRALDRIDVGVLRRGQGLWSAGQASVASLDAFMLADFLAEQRARSAGRVRSVTIGSSFAMALVRSEGARLSRRPFLALRAAAGAVVWWGCRPVLPGPALAAAALIVGYFLVLPLAGTLRQLASGPGLRAQFAGQDHWLSRASVATTLLGVAAWAAVTIPGLAASRDPVLAIIVTAGITAAICRTVTRPPLDYSKPPVPTPFGDVPLDLYRQLARGPLLLAMLILVVVLIR
jgi:Family of unknown function (DUF6297)